jgi:lipoate synthase
MSIGNYAVRRLGDKESRSCGFCSVWHCHYKSDDSALHPKIDEAIQTANVSKAFLEDLRDRLAISQESALVSVLVENLLTRLELSATDLNPEWLANHLRHGGDCA